MHLCAGRVAVAIVLDESKRRAQPLNRDRNTIAGHLLNCIRAKFDANPLLRYTASAGWSSLVARRAHNPKVVSSNLTPATMGA